MPVGAVHGKHEEALWERAKAAAAKQGKSGDYALVMHIFQQMKKSAAEPASGEEKEKSMSNEFSEILAFDVEAELSKACSLDDEPRSEMRSKAPMSKGDDLDQPMDEKSVSPASAEDGHHGGDEMGAIENDPTVHGGGELGKALSTMEQGEPSSGAIDGSQSLSGAGFDVPNEEPWAVTEGISGDGPGQTVILSEDDDDVGSQLTDRKRPLESSIPSWGASDIGADEHMTRDGGDMSKADLGDFDYGRKARAAAAAGLRTSQDVRIGPTGPATSGRAARQEPKGHTWRQGYVTYSTQADEAIAKSIEDGTLEAEPTLNWQAPLVQTRICTNQLCKSRFPAVLTVCPNCLGGHGHGAHGEGGVQLEKSVKDAVRGPVTGDVKFPAGGIVIG